MSEVCWLIANAKTWPEAVVLVSGGILALCFAALVLWLAAEFIRAVLP